MHFTLRLERGGGISPLTERDWMGGGGNKTVK